MFRVFYGVFDFSFVIWLILGAVSVLVVLGANEWLKEKVIPMNWWKWLILSVWYVLLMLGVTAPFTIMGEGEVAAGWRMLLFSLPVFIISGAAVYRILVIGKKEKSAS